ncbi:MAG: dihydroxyacetone kinase subunit L [Endomicrobium sp.]|jgi:dihydroxyacetone kinase-like protein|nr:dihydroxyacetone kinase subunit L [Endomicrobium sp.]
MITLSNIHSFVLGLQAVYTEKKEYLTQLDSPIGDGDHGINMARGFDAVIKAWDAKPPIDIGEAFKTVSMAIIKNVGGSSGPLYGTMFLRMSAFVGKKAEIDLTDWTGALEKGIEGIAQMGKGQKGDKTMLDAFYPALDALKSAESKTLKEALSASAQAGTEGMKGTIPMLAKKGRASYLGERSIGHQDPGATSAVYLLEVAAEKFE